MSIGKLLGMVAVVGVLGLGAVWYLGQLPTVSDYEVAGNGNSMMNEAGTQAADTETNPGVTTNNAQAAVSSETSVDDILAGFEAEAEGYDDSGVDSSFSGNVDEGI